MYARTIAISSHPLYVCMYVCNGYMKTCGVFLISIQSARDIPSLAEVLHCSEEVRSARSEQLKLVRKGTLTSTSAGIDNSDSDFSGGYHIPDVIYYRIYSITIITDKRILLWQVYLQTGGSTCIRIVLVVDGPGS